MIKIEVGLVRRRESSMHENRAKIDIAEIEKTIRKMAEDDARSGTAAKKMAETVRFMRKHIKGFLKF